VVETIAGLGERDTYGGKKRKREGLDGGAKKLHRGGRCVKAKGRNLMSHRGGRSKKGMEKDKKGGR